MNLIDTGRRIAPIAASVLGDSDTTDHLHRARRAAGKARGRRQPPRQSPWRRSSRLRPKLSARQAAAREQRAQRRSRLLGLTLTIGAVGASAYAGRARLTALASRRGRTTEPAPIQPVYMGPEPTPVPASATR